MVNEPAGTDPGRADAKLGVRRREFLRWAGIGAVAAGTSGWWWGSASSAYAAGTRIGSPYLTIGVDPSSGAVTSLQDPTTGSELAAGAGGLMLVDGDLGQPIAFGAATVSSGRGSLTISRTSADGTLTVVESATSFRDVIQWTVHLSETAGRRRLVETRLGLPVNLAAGNWQWYQGIGTEMPVDPNTNYLQTPMSTYYGPRYEQIPMESMHNGTSGVALAIDPREYYAFTFVGCQPALGAGLSLLRAVDVVLEPHTSSDVVFNIYGFRPGFGFRDSIDAYHQTYPEVYAPRPGVDDRIHGTMFGLQFPELRAGNLLWEEFRRQFGGFDWCYAPFRRTGDFYPTPQYWPKFPAPNNGYEKVEPSYSRVPFYNEYGLVSGDTVDIAKYNKVLSDYFDLSEEAIANGFYIIPETCERTLATSAYSDSWWTRFDGSYSDGSGVIPGEPVRHMFAYGDSFGRALLGTSTAPGEMEQIVVQYGPAGIAFDNAPGNELHFGRDATVGAESYIPGRGFMSKRPFTTIGLAYREAMKKARSLTNRAGRPALVIANTPMYPTSNETDVAIIEDMTRIAGWDFGLRCSMGSKPIANMSGNVATARPPGLTDEQWAATVTANVTHEMLFGFLWGSQFYSPPTVQGFDFVQRALPTVIRLSKAGWRATPGVHVSADLQAERFGQGLDALISVTNRGASPVTSTLDFDRAYTGGCMLVGSVYGPAVTMSTANNTTSLKKFTLPGTSAVVVHPVAEFRGGALQATGSVTETATEWTAQLSVQKAPESLQIDGWMPQGAWHASMIVNGESVPVTVQGNSASATISLRAGDNTLQMTWRTKAWLATPDKITAFDYVDASNGEPHSAIVLPAGASHRLTVAAQRLQAYFNYWLARQKQPSLDVSSLPAYAPANSIPIVTTDQVPNSTTNLIAIGAAAANYGTLTPTGPAGTAVAEVLSSHGRSVLAIHGTDDDATDQCMLSMLRLLDTSYPYIGVNQYGAKL